MSTLAVAALIAATVAIVQRNRADDAAATAAEQSRAATDAAAAAERLRVEAEQSAALDHAGATMARAAELADPDLGLLLPLEAHDSLTAAGLVDPAAVTSALYQATYDHRIVARVPVDDTFGKVTLLTSVTVAASPDRSMFAVGRRQGTEVSIVTAATGTVMSTFELEGPAVGSNWDRDNGVVMTGRFDGVIEFWKPNGQHIKSLTVSDRPVWPLLVRNGQLAFAEFASVELGLFGVVVADPDSGRRVWESEAMAEEAFVSPSGTRLAVLAKRLGISVYDTMRWSDVTPDQLRTAVGSSTRLDAAWAATGKGLWVLSDDSVAQYDVETGEKVKSIDPDLAGLHFVSESPDGRLVAIGGYLTPIRVFDSSSGDLVDELAAANLYIRLDNVNGHAGKVDGSSATWVADRHFVLAEEDSTVIWDLSEPKAGASFWPASEIAPVVTSITSSSDRILSATDGDVEIFDAHGRSRISLAAAGEEGTPSLVSGDGSTLAVPARHCRWIRGRRHPRPASGWS